MDLKKLNRPIIIKKKKLNRQQTHMALQTRVLSTFNKEIFTISRKFHNSFKAVSLSYKNTEEHKENYKPISLMIRQS